MDELVAAVDTLQRYAVSGALQRLLGSLPAALASSAVRSLGPWRPLLLPLPTPLELLDRSLPGTVVPLCEAGTTLTTAPGGAHLACTALLLRIRRLTPPADSLCDQQLSGGCRGA